MSGSSLIGVVLAAGESSRFGSTKQLAKYKGVPLVTRAMRMAEEVCGPRSVLVAGNDWRAVADACEPLQGFLLLNFDYAKGIAGSIRNGIRGIAGQADGVLLMLADQPLVTTAHLRLLVDAWRASPDSIAASAYAGTLGPPVIFPQRDFPSLLALSGDRGAKAVLNMNKDRVVAINFEDAAIDIDKPEDLGNLKSV